jgi:DNA-directed RNA polymerase specialized sigma24 family protein
MRSARTPATGPRSRAGSRRTAIDELNATPLAAPPLTWLALLAALRGLPRTQRAAVVLRYWCDLDVRDTAAALGVSEGTVKSASSRGLAALREVLQGSRPQPAPTREVIP